MSTPRELGHRFPSELLKTSEAKWNIEMNQGSVH